MNKPGFSSPIELSRPSKLIDLLSFPRLPALFLVRKRDFLLISSSTEGKLFYQRVYSMPKSAYLLNLKWLFSAIAGLMLSVFLWNCGSKDVSSSQLISEISLVLATGATADEIIAQYPDFSMSNAKLTSRTENKWSLQWQVSQKDRPEALARLRENKLIISVSEQQDSLGPPTNSTNSGYSKTKPIKNQ
ncbi:MAG: hypothetical protein ACKVOK_05545 [Flavobacteriales bacterium]